MATWHQSRRKGRQLYHDTQWTVLTDPPGGFTSMMLFDTQAEAEAFLPKAGPHSYILRPTSEYKRSRDNDPDVNPARLPPGVEQISRVRLNAGGYTSSGHYYGTGQPLFVVYWTDGETDYIRGKDRNDIVRMITIGKIKRSVYKGGGYRIDPNVNPARGGEYDGVAEHELALYAENNADLHRQRFIPIVKNIKRKIKSGKYDPALAPKLWRYYVDDAAKRYIKEFGSFGGSPFNTATRQRLAEALAVDVYNQIVAGEYDDPGVNPISHRIKRTVQRGMIGIQKRIAGSYIIEAICLPRSRSSAAKFYYYTGLKEIRGQNRGVFDDNRNKALHYRKQSDAAKQVQSLKGRLPPQIHQLRVVQA